MRATPVFLYENIEKELVQLYGLLPKPPPILPLGA